MHILTILGSARRHGNTDTVLRSFENQIPAIHTHERIDLIKYKINGCLGCGVCQKDFDQPGCRQKDDVLAIFERLFTADLIVYATPLYCWDFSSQLKSLMDRHYCLMKWRFPGGKRSLLEGRRAALLVTCGDPVENNADIIQTIFRRQMDCLDCTVAGIFILPECPSTPHSLGGRPAILAAQMAEGLLGSTLPSS